MAYAQCRSVINETEIFTVGQRPRRGKAMHISLIVS